MKKKDSNIVKFVLDPCNPPPLSDDQRAELDALEAMPDSAIDHSDIPPLSDEFWKNATCSPLHRPLKQQITVRIDKDVVAWFKAQGKGYQTRMNRILRSAMTREIEKKLSRPEIKDQSREAHLRASSGELVAAKKAVLQRHGKKKAKSSQGPPSS